MAKIINPVRCSDYFNIDHDKFSELGILDPILNVDTKLFIDPLLLVHSSDKVFGDNSRKRYEDHFSRVIRLLKGSKKPNDAPWKAAKKLLDFPEVKHTCLGYGAASISGSGSGTSRLQFTINTAHEIVDLGVEEPDLFVSMALFVEGIGPDRISDMTTNVILDDLIEFTSRSSKLLGIPTEKRTIRLRNGVRATGDLPFNPYAGDNEALLLIPTDVLRDLPIASDWEDVCRIASENEARRSNVNSDIMRMWATRSTKKEKAEMKEWALSNKENFQELIDAIKGVVPTSYDTENDPDGELFWVDLLKKLKNENFTDAENPKVWTRKTVANVIEKIISDFEHLVVNRRHSEDLYSDGKPRNEKASQRLFYAVAYAYCRANNLDIIPEADTGYGPVDFKVSKGFDARALVEIKLSKNGKLVAGYEKQLEAYAKAEETEIAYYLIIDVGSMGNKLEKLMELKNAKAAKGERVLPIVVVDGTRKPSASKLI